MSISKYSCYSLISHSLIYIFISQSVFFVIQNTKVKKRMPDPRFINVPIIHYIFFAWNTEENAYAYPFGKTCPASRFDWVMGLSPTKNHLTAHVIGLADTARPWNCWDVKVSTNESSEFLTKQGAFSNLLRSLFWNSWNCFTSVVETNLMYGSAMLAEAVPLAIPLPFWMVHYITKMNQFWSIYNRCRVNLC